MNWEENGGWLQFVEFRYGVIYLILGLPSRLLCQNGKVYNSKERSAEQARQDEWIGDNTKQPKG